MQNQNLPELLNKYLQYCLVIRNYSKLTAAAYKTSFKLFFKESGITEIRQLNKEDLEKYFFNGRLNRKWKATTFRSYHKHLNCFFKWLIQQQLIMVNPLDGLEKPKLEFTLPRTLSSEDASTVLNGAFHMHYRYKCEKYRNQAVIGIMLLAGLRKNEVVNLRQNDISLENSTIFINQGKGAKDRLVPINARLNQILSDYWKERQRINPESLHFFLSIGKNQSFGQKGINNLISKLRKKVKLDFSAHTLRHAFARLMLEGGCDIYTLSKIMGHSKITTTTIYLSCSTKQMSKSIEMHSLN